VHLGAYLVTLYVAREPTAAEKRVAPKSSKFPSRGVDHALASILFCLPWLVGQLLGEDLFTLGLEWTDGQKTSSLNLVGGGGDGNRLSEASNSNIRSSPQILHIRL
jgi:hypothetical protein